MTANHETQYVEWKAAWQDDHLKWICAFANTEGGVLHIGRNDKGVVIGLEKPKKLLEDLPNKTRDALGILVDVHLRRESGKSFIEIAIDAYPNPISFRGRYYRRSGSTLQEIKGAALDRFLLRRYGRTWDGSPLPGVSAADLSTNAFRDFRKLAQRSGRLDAGALDGSDAQLLEKLKLTEGRYLKRAAALLFHPDPLAFVTGAFVKIGFFRSASDLVYHDEIAGDLFSQARQTLDLLLTKYLKAAITYEDIVRIERFPVPRAALREAVLNAIVHRDYSVPAPLQIRVYEDRLTLWNPAVLPEGWTQETLLAPHGSQPFNPDIANTFFRAGEIEAWGRGIERIFEACAEAGTPRPAIQFDTGGMWTEFPFPKAYLEAISPKVKEEASVKPSVKVSVKAVGKVNIKPAPTTSELILKMLDENANLTLAQVAEALGKTTRAIEMSSSNLVKGGKLRYVGPQRGGHWEVLRPKEES